MYITIELRNGRTGNVKAAQCVRTCEDKDDLEENTMTTTLSPSTPLTAIDRCERCGAQAYVRVTLTAGGDLLFCGHHFREHEPRIRPLASNVLDQTAELSAPSVPSTDDL
jgi:hypothetical protein